MRFRRVFYVGRFQPPHEGHIKSVLLGLELGDEVVIGVRDTRLSASDPLTAEERVWIWRRVLGELGVTRFDVKVVPDFNKNDVIWDDKVVIRGHPLLDWARTVEKILSVSPRDSAFLGNKPPMVIAFNLLGYIVIPGHRSVSKLVDVSATELRRMVMSGDERWRSLLPKPVVDALDEVGFEERLRSLGEEGKESR